MNLFTYLEFVWPEPCQLTMKRCAGGGGVGLERHVHDTLRLSASEAYNIRSA